MIRLLIAALTALALAAGTSVALAQSGPDRQDQQHFRDMTQANMAEVQAGKLAQQRATSDSVKEFAEHMVKDHSRMMEEQRAMAKAKGLQMPGQVKQEHRDAMKKLQAAKGPQFDSAYMAQMVKDHERSLELARTAARSAQDPQLRQMAQKAAPEIEKHLARARDIQDRAAAGATAANRRGQ